MVNGSMVRIPLLVVLACGASMQVHPAGEEGGHSPKARVAEDPIYAKAQSALEEGRYDEALRNLELLAADNPDDADVENLLGYAYRKEGEVDKAFRHYRRALALEPKHLGANEYIGELYLEQGDVASAEKHLKIMRKSFACLFGCEEARELKEAIEAYRSKHGA